MRTSTLLIATAAGALVLPDMAAAQDWSGLYVGVQGGWAETETSTAIDITGPLTTIIPLGVADAEARHPTDIGDHIDGVGAHVGYLFQRGEWVLGGELEATDGGDFQAPELTGFAGRNATITRYYPAQVQSDWAASIRLRGGWLARPTLMIYGVGGYAMRDIDIFSATRIDMDVPLSFGAFDYRIKEKVSGWTLGGGVEWRPVDRWGLRFEYAHTDYGEVSATTPVTGLFGLNPLLQADGRFTASLVQDEVRLGVSYHF